MRLSAIEQRREQPPEMPIDRLERRQQPLPTFAIETAD